MTTSLGAALMATVLVSPSLAQTGTVIIYSDAYSRKNTAAGLLPKSQQPFTGWLFDGPQPIAHVRPGRFMAFHLKAGEHSFTVPWHSSRPGKDALVINVEDDSRHCIRLSAKMTNYEVIPWESLDSQMEEVPCRLAQQGAAHFKPLDIKRVEAAVRSELDRSTTFPGDRQPQR